MAVTFDPDTGLTAPEAAEIREAIVADWQAIFDDDGYTLSTDSESPAGQIIDAETVLVTAKDAEILYLANMFNPLTAEGIWQDAIGKIYYLTRKTNESTLVTCTCTGLQGTVIPQGAVVQDTSGNQFTAQTDGTIPAAGSISLTFAAEETGALDVAANTVTKIVTVIPGWDTVNNTAAGAAGRIAETRGEFEARRYASVAQNAHGSVSSLRGALKNLSGVLDCDILENVTDTATTKSGVSVPGHSIAICIYGGTNDDIAETIYNKLDAGCGTTGGTEVTYLSEDDCLNTYQILRPTATNVYIKVTFTKTSTTPTTITDDIKNAIYNDFYGSDDNSGNERVTLNSTVYASRFSVCLIKTAGVQNLESINIGWAASPTGTVLSINANVEPTLSKDNITVVMNDED